MGAIPDREGLGRLGLTKREAVWPKLGSLVKAGELGNWNPPAGKPDGRTPLDGRTGSQSHQTGRLSSQNPKAGGPGGLNPNLKSAEPKSSQTLSRDDCKECSHPSVSDCEISKVHLDGDKQSWTDASLLSRLLGRTGRPGMKRRSSHW